MLAAGGRRMFNANQIFRDPAWRREDPDGALLINSSDLSELGAKDGDWIAVESVVGKRGVNTLIPALKAAGARDILELPISKIVE